MTVPLRTAPRVFLCLVLSNLVVTSAELPNVPKPETKAAFDQILQANMEIEPDYFSSPPLPDEVFEGDIILTADQLFNIDIYGDVRGNVSQASGSDSRIRWPNGIIPYEIDCSLKNMPDALSAIQTAMKEWESKTCIRFVKKTSQKDYLWFFRQKGCWCNVGRIGGKTSLSVGHGCEFTHVMVHEIGHAVGFWHEQSRPDRDRYVQVMKQNILPGFDTAFAKYKRDKIDSLGLQYDYGSIMHYPFHAFSKNGQPTLRALRPLNGKKPYQALSNLDAEQTNRMYECSKRRKRRQIAYCRDYSYYCRSWARNGECLRNPNYMRQYCRKSCVMCGTSACVDGSYLCPSWARSGYCGANPGYMRVNCKKSCGLCPRPPTVRPRPPTVRPKPPTVRPKPPTARPKPPTVKPKPPTVKPKPPTTKPLPPGVSCGVRRYGNSAGRIVNGKTAVKNSWPWQAQLKLNGAHKCGGSLVASRWVLTAAHCLKGTSYNPGYRVTLGEHNLRVPEDSEQFFSVKKIIVHPSYQRSTNDYDVALLELDRPAALNKAVSLICLPKQGQSVSVGTYCSITGWGRTGYNRPGAAVLQEASLPIAQQHTCRYNMRYWGQVTSKMLCGGFGGSSTVSGCFGDSGGPFVCKQSGGKYILHGVVSWGTRSCSAGRNEYTVFARVSEFEYWIRKYIGQGVKPPKTPPPPNTPPPPQTPPPPNTPPPPQTPPPPNTPPPSQTPPPPNTPPPPQTPSSKTSVPQTPVTSKPGCVEPKALGMEDFTISNSQITASRSWNELHGPHQARLNLPVGKGGIGAWCPGRQNTEEYLQVDFLEKTVVTHVATQGRESPYPKYVKQYMLSSSDDGTVWALHPEVFEGNNDMSTVKKNQLANPVVARYIRIHPTAWEVDICLRAEFYGCPVKPPKPTTSPDLTTTQARTTSQPITTEKPSTHPKPSTPPKPVTDKPPVTSRPRPPIIVPEEPTGMKCEDRHPSCSQFAQAGQCSTNPSWMKENCKKSCGSKRCDKQPVRPTAPCSSPLGVGWDFKLPDSAFSASSTLDVGGGWDSSARNARMYFEDEVKSKRIGAWCAANPENQWLQVDLGTNKYITAVGTQGRHKYYEHVKSYKLATSVDGFSWNFVKQVSGEEKVFPGSCDHFTPVINRLPRGVTARYIRFYPVTYNYVCMRVEVYGCRA